MASLNVWQRAYDGVTLRDDGDPSEIDGATKFGLDARFPNYELFWRRHIVPATNRPANFDLRQLVSPVVANIGRVSHGVFCDLLGAERSLEQVRAGDLGPRFQNCVAALKSGGDAMQKFDDLQRKRVEAELAARLGIPLAVWTRAQWNSTWKPAYTRLAAYRNFLTHSNLPQVTLVGQASGPPAAFVPHENHFHLYEPLSWPDQQARYGSHPAEWDRIEAVCARVQDETIAWLDRAYAELLKCLDPLRASDDYQDLWGWDTPKHGSQSARRANAIAGSQAASIGSGCGFAGS